MEKQNHIFIKNFCVQLFNSFLEERSKFSFGQLENRINIEISLNSEKITFTFIALKNKQPEILLQYQ